MFSVCNLCFSIEYSGKHINTWVTLSIPCYGRTADATKGACRVCWRFIGTRFLRFIYRKWLSWYTNERAVHTVILSALWAMTKPDIVQRTSEEILHCSTQTWAGMFYSFTCHETHVYPEGIMFEPLVTLPYDRQQPRWYSDKIKKSEDKKKYKQSGSWDVSAQLSWIGLWLQQRPPHESN